MAVHRVITGLPAAVADIGATNLRFARLTTQGALGPVTQFATDAYPDVKAALDALLELSGGPRPVRLGLAVAGPVYGDQVKLTNAPWYFSIRRLKKQLDLTQLEVVNDLEALALSLPDLTPKDTVALGGDVSRRPARAPMAVLGPGTGMGMAGLVPVDQGWRPIASEGGYTNLSPLTDREMAAWKVLRESHGRVSVERVLSGPGIVELHAALAFLDDRDPGFVTPENIVKLALKDESQLAVETVGMFCAWLGDVAGDVALMYLARGGVYLAGRILVDILEPLRRSQFRDRFENKGRGTNIVDHIPAFVVTASSPVLLGCAHYLNSSFQRTHSL